jgi:hypothetical protein
VVQRVEQRLNGDDGDGVADVVVDVHIDDALKVKLKRNARLAIEKREGES